MTQQAPQAEQPTVLVVNDEVAIVKVLRDFLEAEGFGVLAAHDGAEALATLARERVDCLLLDIMMPGADGFDVGREIRATSDVPILFLTARGRQRQAARLPPGRRRLHRQVGHARRGGGYGTSDALPVLDDSSQGPWYAEGRFMHVDLAG